MLTIPNDIKTLFKTDGVKKNFRVHFPNGENADLTNENIVQESVKFTESICSQEVFRFGLAEDSVIEFETVGVPNIYGVIIECGIEIDTTSLSAAQISAISANPGDGVLVLAVNSDIGFGFYRIPLGTFRVDTCPRNHEAMTHRLITAYSVMLNDIALNFPTGAPFPTMFTYKSVIDDLAEGNLTKIASYGFHRSTSGRGRQLYNSSGTAVFVSIMNYIGSTPYVALNDNQVTVVNNVFPAFIRATMPDYDPAAYDAFGVSVANALTNAGWNLTYDSSGNQIYGNNEIALRECCPWFFRPVVYYSFFNPKIATNNAVSAFYQGIGANEYAPVLSSSSLVSNNPAFYYKTNSYDMGVGACAFLCLYNENGAASLTVNATVNGGSAVNLSVSSAGVPKVAHTLDVFSASALSGKLRIENSGAEKIFYTNNANYKTVKDTGYFFDALRLLEIESASRELSGEFLRPARAGGLEVKALDSSAPTAISTSDFHGGAMWWDEYSASPIGTVLLTFGDEDGGETTVEIPVGNGTSIYEMTDNAMLKLFASSTLNDIAVLLNGDFATHAAAVAFTPIEMTMQGWPWLEAGDALQITADDGSVVDTFALRIEMSGIQNLFSVITAQGGEIIKDGALRYGSGGGSSTPISLFNGLTSEGLTFPANVKLANGGYIKIGRLVVVNMRLTFSGAFSTNATIVSGLPAPVNDAGLGSSTAVVPVAAASSSTWALRVNGAIYTREAITSGMNVVIAAAYISND